MSKERNKDNSSREQRLEVLFSDIIEASLVPPSPPLTPLQQDALQALHRFIAAEDGASFSVLGMTATGKSHLLYKLAEELAQGGKQVIVLEPNLRLAAAAGKASSIYAYIYPREPSKDPEAEAAEQKNMLVFPLLKCEDEADCVYLLDDAHLLSNSRFITHDGKRYGSGRLLTDFFAFVADGSTRRKMVFFADPYQIQRTSVEDSVLTGAQQLARGLSHQSLTLSQIIDTTGGSAKLANAEKLVTAIASRQFAALELVTDPNFRIIAPQDARNIARELVARYRDEPHKIWYLTETHDKANRLTRWLREQLYGKKLLATVETGELLEIYVIPDGEQVMLSGRRVTVAKNGPCKTYSQGLTWVADGPVVFHSQACRSALATSKPLYVLEEFLTAERPELDKKTAVAISVWHKKSKKRQSFTYARYGYASTLHHALGMSQPVCYINCSHSAGSHTDSYFRWLYSAITTAESEVVLVNFTPVHPFDSASWQETNVTVTADIQVGAGWSIPATDAAAPLVDPLPGLMNSKNAGVSQAIWQRVAAAAAQQGWQGIEATCHPWMEQYQLVGPGGETCCLRVAWNGKNMVRAMHISDAAHWPLLAEIAASCLQSAEFTQEAQRLLQTLRTRLLKQEWLLVSASETAWRLALTVVRGPHERVAFELYFDKQGLVTRLRPGKTSDIMLLDDLKGALL